MWKWHSCSTVQLVKMQQIWYSYHFQYVCGIESEYGIHHPTGYLSWIQNSRVSVKTTNTMFISFSMRMRNSKWIWFSQSIGVYLKWIRNSRLVKMQWIQYSNYIQRMLNMEWRLYSRVVNMMWMLAADIFTSHSS